MDRTFTSAANYERRMNMSEDKKIVWRLKYLPEAGEVADLVTAGVLSKEEAREIILKESDKEDVKEQVGALKEQIEYQQELIDQLLNKIDNSHHHIGWKEVTYTPRHPTTCWMNANGTTLGGGNTINLSSTSAGTGMLMANKQDDGTIQTSFKVSN